MVEPEAKAAYNEQQEEEFDPYMVFVFCLNLSKPPKV